MDAVQPRSRVVRRSCAPKTCPCPQCGKVGHRKLVHTRRVRDIAYREILILELEVGEYRATCGCCKTFRAPTEGIATAATPGHVHRRDKSRRTFAISSVSIK